MGGTAVGLRLVGALVDTFSAAPALANVLVLRGSGNTDDPGDYLMVGVVDPDAERPQIVESRQSWAGLGARSRDETGTVSCVALSWNGNASAQEASEGVIAITDAIEDAMRADPNLGGAVPGLLWVGYGEDGSAELIEATDGTAVLWRFTIAYKARI